MGPLLVASCPYKMQGGLLCKDRTFQVYLTGYQLHYTHYSKMPGILIQVTRDARLGSFEGVGPNDRVNGAKY